MKLVLMTDPSVDDMREVLRHIYANIYVEFLVKNALYKQRSPATCELFVSALQKWIRGQPVFASAP